MNNNPIIVALDASTPGEIEFLCEQLSGHVGMFKLGFESIYSMGSAALDIVATFGNVFYDCKLHDIPNTVGAASRQIAGYRGVGMFNVHALGGSDMMRASVEAATEVGGESRPIVLAVTLLTSVEQNDLDAMGLPISKTELVPRLAVLAQEAGCDGVVAAVEDVAAIRKATGKGFKIVTPGIRPAGSVVGDQKRIATPSQAIEAGSDYLVIGRPITQAEDPAVAAKEILRELKDSKVSS